MNAVIVEEQWIAVKSFFYRIKNYVSFFQAEPNRTSRVSKVNNQTSQITDGPATTTITISPKFIPRATMQTIRRQPSRLNQNSQ